MSKVKTPAFYFLGIAENNIIPLLIELEIKLKTTLSESALSINFSKKDELLILALNDPDFRYYIIITSEDKFRDYRMLAKDFELPWDEKPTNKNKLELTFEAMKKRKWFDFDPHTQVGFTILDTMLTIPFLKTYSIPSFK